MNSDTPQREIDSGIATAQGLLHIKLSQYQQAISCFDEAIKINPTNWNALQARAFCKGMLISETPLQQRAKLVSECINDSNQSVKFLTKAKDFITRTKS